MIDGWFQDAGYIRKDLEDGNIDFSFLFFKYNSASQFISGYLILCSVGLCPAIRNLLGISSLS